MVKVKDFVELYDDFTEKSEIYQVILIEEEAAFCYNPRAVVEETAFSTWNTEVYQIITNEEMLQGLRENFYANVAFNE